MWRYIFKKGYFRLIFAIGNNKKNITQLSKEVGMTISHLARVLDYWEKEGLIIKHKTPEKSAEICLTEQGKKLNMIITDIYHMANQAESKVNKLERECQIKNQKSKETSGLTSEEKSSTPTQLKKVTSKTEKPFLEKEQLMSKTPTTRKESERSTQTPKQTEPGASKESSSSKS